MSALLGGAPEGIVLGAAATKPHLRAMPLGTYRVVAFATHGLIAGDISGVAEPGLVLTPPAIPTANDNGFLSASEVATLDFHADLIILSACNTGSTAGEGGDGLSGLAKSFFFAGGRTLLVSHWSVDSSAALDLTTTMIKLKAANPSESYPEALREAIIAMKAGADVGVGHPGVWGPLEIVGN